MKLKQTCDECQTTKVLHCEYTVGLGPTSIGYRILRTYKTYRCGHTEILDRDLEQEAKEYADKQKAFGSLSGSKCGYEYQQSGTEFMVQALKETGGVLNADSMGLGKTIQGLLSARHMDVFPILTIVKSVTTFQWIRETHEWLDNSHLSCFPIIGSKGLIPPGFKNYLISMDTLGRNGTWKKLLHLGIKLIIIDECHSFKDPSANRTIALIELITTAKIKYKILLSGTPIKNRASEYFTTLNMLAPDYFPSRGSFKRRWLLPETTDSGVVVYKRLNPSRIDQFKDLISKWVIRREKEEVLLDLPRFTRNMMYVSIGDPLVKNSYNKQLDLLQNLMDRGEDDTFSLLGELAKLRRITGMAKVPACVEYINEFLESVDDFKIAIGIHHKDVLNSLYYALDKWRPLKLSGEDSTIGKDNVVQMFKESGRRVLIINEIAGGVGLNLQMCANTLVLERQWNAANEEQFESRFHRNGQTLPVVADYLIATGTIDDWFSQMVEEKRKIFGETITNWEFSSDAASIRDLAETTLRNRL